MRKLLLATSALLGASVGIVGTGYAGTLTPNAPNPAPGSITVTLNALVEAFITDSSDTGTLPQYNGGNKTATYGVASYSRLYPSFDGVLANGLKYGGSIEIRHYSGYTGSVASSAADAGSFYVQREFLYLGTDKIGKVEVGSPVQPTELFQVGNPANFNTGGWDGDLPGVFHWGLPYFIDDDNDRANKVVYVSPQFSGFDFGVSFEPNNYGNDFAKYATRTTSVSSTPAFDPVTGDFTGYTTPSEYGRRSNTVDGAARYQGTFGAIGVKADVGGSFGGTVTSNTGPQFYTNAVTGAVQQTPGVPNYKNFSMFAAGLSVTFGGLELDGHTDIGKFGPDLTPLPSGGGNTEAWVVGGSYTIGPWIFGASYYGFSSGYTQATSTDCGTVGFASCGSTNGYGLAAGGTYTIAPGASLFLEYLYGHQHANGVNLVDGTTNTSTDPYFGSNTRAQAFGIGTAFKW